MTGIDTSRVSVLQMNEGEARDFFLKGESYCNFDLPPYFEFDQLLKGLNDQLRGKDFKSIRTSNPRGYDNLNHIILNNKDGKFAWRPLQLTHPALYVSIVQELTKSNNWDLVLNRFRLFQRNPRIRCLSLPVASQSIQRDKAEQILQWWEEIEQESIALSLEYEYIAHTDISDCYGSIYTHSIPWALHRRSVMKRPSNRSDGNYLGNVIDWRLQDINHGQTNGIPQGSVLDDFIAEIVLGYADFILTAKLRKTSIVDYQILRYRDDYRVFTNHPTQGEEILKLISETMYFLGMKLSPSKTLLSDEVVRKSIKPDKIEWVARKNSVGDLQKHLLLVHNFAAEYPNSGSLVRALSDFHKRLHRASKPVKNPLQMIALVVDIAVDSPKIFSLAAGILSELIGSLKSNYERRAVLMKIKRRFDRVANTGHLQLWLQRITYFYDRTICYDEPLSALVVGGDPEIWNNSWISGKKRKEILSAKNIFKKEKLSELKPTISPNEVELFHRNY